MSPSSLDYTIRDNVLHITIMRAEKRNALSPAVLEDIREVFAGHRDRKNLIAASIRGDGERCFAAGGDVHAMDQIRDEVSVARMQEASTAALEQIRTFPVPVIAALNGDAIGGGAELAVACDWRVFAAHARIAFAQATLNITPAWGGASDLIALVGPATALRLMSSAAMVDADEALRVGLADYVGNENDDMSAALDAFISPLRERRPQVMRALKSVTLTARLGNNHKDVRAAEAQALRDTWLHPDHFDASARVLEGIRSRRAAAGKKGS